MARTNTGCRCRVPLSEAAVPAFVRTDELLRWADQHGVGLEMDHINRLSVSVDDAYRLRDEANAASEKHAAEEAARKAKLQADIDKAQEKRQRAFSDAYTASMAADAWPSKAMDAGRAALAEAERGLDSAVRNQLGPVAVPDVPVNAGRFVGEEL
jgi:hypothetical protein